MKAQFLMIFAAAAMLTACSDPGSEVSIASQDRESAPGLGYSNPIVDKEVGLEAGTGTVKQVVVGSGSSPMDATDLLIKTEYDRYLPNCYNQTRADAWKKFFNQGGTSQNFIATLVIVASATSCDASGAETNSDPHFIKGYYEFYLPGCYSAEKHQSWQQFFDRGGTDTNFRITLANVAVSSPRPSCLR